MKTRILLIGLIIFLVNVISVNAKEVDHAFIISPFLTEGQIEEYRDLDLGKICINSYDDLKNFNKLESELGLEFEKVLNINDMEVYGMADSSLKSELEKFCKNHECQDCNTSNSRTSGFQSNIKHRSIYFSYLIDARKANPAEFKIIANQKVKSKDELEEKAYPRGTIKTCYDNYISKEGWNNFVFPKDGGKPYGSTVGMLLAITNPLNLEVIFEEVKDWNKCLNKMRNGKADIVVNISDKDDRKNYMELIPYLKWKDGSTSYFGISKKSKFISRIAEFKSALLSNDDFMAISNTKFTSAYQHDWGENKGKYESPLPGALLVTYKRGSEKEKGLLSFPGCKTKSPVEWSSERDYSFYVSNEFNMIFCLSEGKINGFFKSNKIEGFFDPPFDINAIGNEEGSILKQFNLKVKTSRGNGKMEITDRMSSHGGGWHRLDGKIFVNGKLKVKFDDITNSDGYNKNDDHYTPKNNLLVSLDRLQDKVKRDEYESKLPPKKPKSYQELATFYTAYAGLKKCYEARKGYVAVHVNSVEMKNIKSKAKSIENGIFNKYPKVKPMKDEIWNKFTKTVSTNEILQATLKGKEIEGVPEITSKLSDWQEVCNGYKTVYNMALKMYGGGGTTEKDF
jgi:hypothetical protein